MEIKTWINNNYRDLEYIYYNIILRNFKNNTHITFDNFCKLMYDKSTKK